MTDRSAGLTIAVLIMTITAGAFADPGPAGVTPWDGTDVVLPSDRPVTSPFAPAGGPGMQAGADHIVAQQCAVGGWCWPHGSSCCPAGPNNVTAPIALGVLDAYAHTADAAHLASAVLGGDYDLTSQYPGGQPRFGSFTPYFLYQLTQVSGDPQYADHATANFFTALNDGTYGSNGDLDTAGWIQMVKDARTGTWINLRPWEFHTLIHTCYHIGHVGQAALFKQALLDGLNTLDNTDPANVYVDLLGLSGGVRGLALSGTQTFAPINSPLHAGINGIDNLEDLTAQLASYQNADGSWYWNSDLPAPTAGDEDTQVTAYAVLALIEADRWTAADYTTAIADGKAWLLSMQQPSGAFVSYPGGSENTEVEGEALSAIASEVGDPPTVPTVSEWGLVVMTLIGFALATVMFERRRRTA